MIHNTNVSGFPERLQETSHVSAQMLLTDLDLAMTFLDVAQTSDNEETVKRNHQNARKAYDTVLGFLMKLPLDAADAHAVEAKLADLKVRLEAVGFRL